MLQKGTTTALAMNMCFPRNPFRMNSAHLHIHLSTEESQTFPDVQQWNRAPGMYKPGKESHLFTPVACISTVPAEDLPTSAALRCGYHAQLRVIQSMPCNPRISLCFAACPWPGTETWKMNQWMSCKHIPTPEVCRELPYHATSWPA